MAYDITRTVYLELAGVPLATPAWECANPMELAKPAQRRGQDRVIPGAAGVRTKRRRTAITRRTLSVVVGGTFKWDGTTHTAPETGLQLNLAHLRTALLPTDGLTITAIVHKPDGTTISGEIQVEELDWEYHNVSADALISIDLTIPGGELS